MKNKIIYVLVALTILISIVTLNRVLAMEDLNVLQNIILEYLPDTEDYYGRNTSGSSGLMEVIQYEAELEQANGGVSEGYITLDDLENVYYIFCREHGAHVPGEKKVTISAGTGKYYRESDGAKYLKLGQSIELLHQEVPVKEAQSIGGNPYEGTIKNLAGDANQSETYAYYEIVESVHSKDTKIAYILAEMYKNIGGYPSYVQIAFWTTVENLGATEGENDLSKEAQAFEDYIKEAEALGDPTCDYEESTVSYNKEGYYLVGPFSLNYIRAYAQVGSREKVSFSGIIDAQIMGDKGEIVDWEFFYPEGKQVKENDEDYQYPYQGEQFYLKIPYSSNNTQTKIQKMVVTFEEMHAEAQYDRLEGRYNIVTWTAEQIENWCYEGQPCEEGNTNVEHGPTVHYRPDGCGCNGHTDSDGNKSYCSSSQCCDGHPCTGAKPCGCSDQEDGPKCVPHLKSYTYYIKGTAVQSLPAQKLISVIAAKKYKEQYSITWDFEDKLKLTIDIAGQVWLDGHQAKAAEIDGLLNASEPGIKGVKVYLRDIETDQIVVNGNGKEMSVITDESGKYEFTEAPVGSYYVDFRFDGQTYMATEHLVGTGVPANGSEANSNPAWETNSKAAEVDRIGFNNKFQIITKDSAIGEAGTISLVGDYDTTSEPGKSIIQPRDENEVAKEKFEMQATTKQAGLTIPLDDKFHIENYEKIIGSEGIFYPIYPNLKYINLGLITRTEADFAIKKDVNLSTVTINEKQLNYKYNSRQIGERVDEEESFDITVKNTENEQIHYNTAIYKSDYNFRIEDYKSSEQLGNAAADYIREQKGYDLDGDGIPDQELKVFVQYKMVLKNSSETDFGTINQVVDYFDPTYKLVAQDVVLPIQDQNGNVNDKIVAYASTYETNKGQKGEVIWNVSGTNNGYNQMTTDSFKDIVLASGDSITFYVTFEVAKATDQNGLVNAVKLGTKNNTIEIYSYSTYSDESRSRESVEGRIDRDSQPGNVVPGVINTYEDDTDAAPRITIAFAEDNERKLTGVVWEDARYDEDGTLLGKQLSTGQIVGNGIREDKETLINGATIQLVELVELEGKTYEYIWREMSTGENIYQYVGNNGIVYNSGEGSASRTLYEFNDIKTGEYKFESFVAGNFIVRFKYGDTTKTLLTTKNGGNNEKSYNGHDYKSTAYQTGFNTLNEELHDLYNTSLRDAKVSDAFDNEARRLETIAYTKTTYNTMAKILGLPYTDNPSAQDIQTLIDNTWMYADTEILKIEVEIENTQYDTTYNTDGTQPHTYFVKDIDLGLEERPKTSIELEKRVARVRVLLSNGTVIIDTSDANRVNQLQADWERPTVLGERIPTQIILDEAELSQGTTVMIDYSLTAINDGEVDTTGELFDLTPDQMREVANAIRQDTSGYTRGQYVGSTYYTGQDGSPNIVTTKVDKLLDYVDNSIVFRKEDNNTENQNWDLVNYEELRNQGLIDQDLLVSQTGENVTNNVVIISQPIVTEELGNKGEDALKATISEDKEKTTVSLYLTKQLAQGNEEDDMSFFNIAEIIQLTNSVGRRDYDAIYGDQDPSVEPKQPDTDNTQQVVVIPPYGANLSNTPIIIFVSILAVAIVILIIMIPRIKRRK